MSLSNVNIKSLTRDPSTPWKRMMDRNIESMRHCNFSIEGIRSGSVHNNNVKLKQENYKLQRKQVAENCEIEKSQMIFKVSSERIHTKTGELDIAYCSKAGPNILNQQFNGGNIDVQDEKMAANVPKENLLEKNDTDEWLWISINLGNIGCSQSEDSKRNTDDNVTRDIHEENKVKECIDESGKNVFNSGKSMCTQETVSENDPVSFIGYDSAAFPLNHFNNAEAVEVSEHTTNEVINDAVAFIEQCAAHSQNAGFSAVDEHENKGESFDDRECLIGGLSIRNFVKSDRDVGRPHKYCCNASELGSSNVSTRNLSNGKISARDLSNDKVSARDLSSEEVSEKNLSSDKASARDVSNDEVKARDVSNNKVSARDLSNDKVRTRDLNNDKVSTRDLSNDKVNARDLNNDKVHTRDLNNDKVSTRDLSNDKVSTRDLSNDKVNARDLSNDKVNARDWSNGNIGARNLCNGKVANCTECLKKIGETSLCEADSTEHSGNARDNIHMENECTVNERVQTIKCNNSELPDTSFDDCELILSDEDVDENSTENTSHMNNEETKSYLYIHTENEFIMHCKKDLIQDTVSDASFKLESRILPGRCDITVLETFHKEGSSVKERTKTLTPSAVKTMETSTNGSNGEHTVSSAEQTGHIAKNSKDLNIVDGDALYHPIQHVLCCTNTCIDVKYMQAQEQNSSVIDLCLGSSFSKKNLFMVHKSASIFDLPPFQRDIRRQNRLCQSASAENIVAGDRWKTQSCQMNRVKPKNVGRISHIDVTDVKISQKCMISDVQGAGDGWTKGDGKGDYCVSLKCLEQDSVGTSKPQPSSLKWSQKEHESNRKLKNLTRNPMTQWKRLVDINIESMRSRKVCENDRAKYGGGDFEAHLLSKTEDCSVSDRVLEQAAIEFESSVQNISVLKAAHNDVEKLGLSHDVIMSLKNDDYKIGTYDVYVHMGEVTDAGQFGNTLQPVISKCCKPKETKTAECMSMCNVEVDASLKHSNFPNGLFDSDYSELDEEDSACSDCECQIFSDQESVHAADKSTVGPASVECQQINQKIDLVQGDLYGTVAADCNINYSKDIIPPMTSVDYTTVSVNKVHYTPVVNFEVTSSLEACCLPNDIDKENSPCLSPGSPNVVKCPSVHTETIDVVKHTHEINGHSDVSRIVNHLNCTLVDTKMQQMSIEVLDELSLHHNHDNNPHNTGWSRFSNFISSIFRGPSKESSHEYGNVNQKLHEEKNQSKMPVINSGHKNIEHDVVGNNKKRYSDVKQALIYNGNFMHDIENNENKSLNKICNENISVGGKHEEQELTCAANRKLLPSENNSCIQEQLIMAVCDANDLLDQTAQSEVRISILETLNIDTDMKRQSEGNILCRNQLGEGCVNTSLFTCEANNDRLWTDDIMCCKKEDAKIGIYDVHVHMVEVNDASHFGDTLQPIISDHCEPTEIKTAGSMSMCNIEDNASLDHSNFPNGLCDSDYSELGEEGSACPVYECQILSEQGFAHAADKSTVGPASIECQHIHEKNGIVQADLYSSIAADCDISHFVDIIPPVISENHKTININKIDCTPVVSSETTASQEACHLSYDLFHSDNLEDSSMCHSLGTSNVLDQKYLPESDKYAVVAAANDKFSGEKVFCQKVSEIDDLDQGTVCEQDCKLVIQESAIGDEIMKVTNKYLMSLCSYNSEQISLLDSHASDTIISNALFSNLCKSKIYTQTGHSGDCEELGMENSNVVDEKSISGQRASSPLNRTTKTDVSDMRMVVTKSYLTEDAVIPTCINNAEEEVSSSAEYQDLSSEINHLEISTFQNSCSSLKVLEKIQDKSISLQQIQSGSVVNQWNNIEDKKFNVICPSFHIDSIDVVHTHEINGHNDASRIVNHLNCTFIDPKIHDKSIEILDELSLPQNHDDNPQNAGWSRFSSLMSRIFRGPSKESFQEYGNVNHKLSQQKRQNKKHVIKSGNKNIEHNFVGNNKNRYSDVEQALTYNVKFVHNIENNGNKSLNKICNENASEQELTCAARKKLLPGGNNCCVQDQHVMAVCDANDLLDQTAQSKVRISTLKNLNIETDMTRQPEGNILFNDHFGDGCVKTAILTCETNNDRFSSSSADHKFSAMHTETLQKMSDEWNTNILSSEVLEIDMKNTQNSHSNEYKKRFHDFKTKVPVLITRPTNKTTPDFRKVNQFNRSNQNEEELKENNKHKHVNVGKIINSENLETEMSIMYTGDWESEIKKFPVCQKGSQKKACGVDGFQKDVATLYEDPSEYKSKIESDISKSETKCDVGNNISRSIKNSVSGIEVSFSTVQSMDKPNAVKEILTVSTDTISNNTVLSEYFKSALKLDGTTLEKILEPSQLSCRDESTELVGSDLLQSSLECLLEMLLQRGKVIHAFVANIEGEVLAKTANFDVTASDIKNLTCSLFSSYTGMMKIAIFNDVYTCFKHDQDSSLVGSAATGIFVAHRGKQNFVVGFSDPTTPGSCIKEIQEISHLLSNRGL